MKRVRRWLVWGALVVGGFGVGPGVGAARADVPPLDVEACLHKDKDAACQTEAGAAGHCGDGSCSRARPQGSSTDYACFRCLPGAPAATPEATKKSGCEGGSDTGEVSGALVAILGLRVLGRRALKARG